MSHNKYIHFGLHVQPSHYAIHSFYSLHTTSLKYNTVKRICYAGKRLLCPFLLEGQRMGYGDTVMNMNVHVYLCRLW